MTPSRALSSSRPTREQRASERIPVLLPARLTWKDQRGSARFATVVTRDVSEYGVFVECQTPIAISPFRLVQFQLEREARDADGLPESLRHGRLLSAVYRVQPATRSGGRQGLALRLMVDPRRRTPAVATHGATRAAAPGVTQAGTPAFA